MRWQLLHIIILLLYFGELIFFIQRRIGFPEGAVNFLAVGRGGRAAGRRSVGSRRSATAVDRGITEGGRIPGGRGCSDGGAGGPIVCNNTITFNHKYSKNNLLRTLTPFSCEFLCIMKPKRFLASSLFISGGMGVVIFARLSHDSKNGVHLMRKHKYITCDFMSDYLRF